MDKKLACIAGHGSRGSKRGLQLQEKFLWEALGGSVVPLSDMERPVQSSQGAK